MWLRNVGLPDDVVFLMVRVIHSLCAKRLAASLAVLIGSSGGGAILGGCANPESAVGFTEPDTAARMRAIRRAGALQDQQAVPALISRLDSDDPAERLLAIRTLEKITGETQRFEYAASKEQREAGVRKWVEWYAQAHAREVGGVSAMNAGVQTP